MKVRIPFVKCHENAKLPTQEAGNVGFDLFVAEDAMVSPGAVVRVRSGIKLAAPVTLPGAGRVPFFKIEGRSGLASKGVFPVGGIVDPNYRGEIMGLMTNASTIPHFLCKGDRFAQLVLYVTLAKSDEIELDIVEVPEVEVHTDRGDKGFGSSGA